ncbi:MAG: hypothetical protein ACEPOW_03200 [Bacteroidales bacterium]
MKKGILFFAFLTAISVFSCKNKDNWVVTKKVQYDVQIISPDPSYDWWIQNIVGPDRDRLTDLLIEAPAKGKIKAYDYFNEPLSVDAVQKLLSDTVSVTMSRKTPPYELFDTNYIKEIKAKDIVKVRFLEEWRMDTVSLQMEKKVYGISPIIKFFDQDGKFRGYQPLYWIYTDKDFKKIVKVGI